MQKYLILASLLAITALQASEKRIKRPRLPKIIKELGEFEEKNFLEIWSCLPAHVDKDILLEKLNQEMNKTRFFLKTEALQRSFFMGFFRSIRDNTTKDKYGTIDKYIKQLDKCTPGLKHHVYIRIYQFKNGL